MKFLDVCAGIGGFSIGLEMAGMTCAGQVEIDDYCNKILKKHWPHVPRWEDVKTLNPAELPTTELVCGGYPCQPFSVAGQRKGQEDDRHLWPFILAIVAANRPTWCLFENVAGHITLGLDRVLSDLEAQGYAAWPLVIPACGVDAPHRRDRVWIIAHTASRHQYGVPGGVLRQFQKTTPEARSKIIRQPNHAPNSDLTATTCETLAHANRHRCQGTQILQQRGYSPAGHSGGDRRQSPRILQQRPGVADSRWRPWPAEPGVGRVVDGVSVELDKTARRLGFQDGRNQDAVTAVDQFRKEMLREMWAENCAVAASLQFSQQEKGGSSLPGVPRILISDKLYMRERLGSSRKLRRLWRNILTRPFDFEETQDRLQRVLIRIRQKECREKLSKGRVDRIRALGNAVIPKLIYQIGHAIMAAHTGKNNE